MSNSSNRSASWHARARRRSQSARLLLDSGRIPGDASLRALAEQLESRVMLAIFDPAGTGIGTLAQSNLSLTRSDRVIVDIDPVGAASHNDQVNVSGALSLNGVLQLRLANGPSLTAGSRFDIMTLSGGSIGGAFAAIEGLDANGAPLDFVAIQGPTKLTIVATDLPTANFTLRVNSDSEATALADFFAAGSSNGLTDSATFTGAIFALGQHIHGSLTFAEATSGGTNIAISVADGAADADKARITTATTDGTNIYSVFGPMSLTLRGRTEPVNTRGLRTTAGFTGTAYSLGDSIVPVSPTAGFSSRLGAFSFENITPTISGFVLRDQIVTIDAGIAADALKLTFQGSGGSNSSGVKAEGTGVTATYGVGLQYDGSSISRTTGRGRFSIAATQFDAEVPGVLKATATGITLAYDPDQDRTQTLLSLSTMDIEFPKFHLSGHVMPAQGSTDPGLVIRGDGFLFGSLTVVLNTGDFGSADPEGFLTVASFLKLKNPSFTITNFGMTFNPDGSLAGGATVGSLGLGVEEFRVSLASGIMGSGTNIAAVVTLDPVSHVPTGYSLTADTLHFEVPNVVVADAENVALTYDPAGDRTQTLFSVGTMDVQMPKLHLSAHITPAPNSTDPGLVIRGDGFLFGSLSIVLNTGDFGSADPEGFLTIASFLKVKDPSFTITNFGMSFNPDGSLNGASVGSISLAVAEFRVSLASGIMGSGTDIAATLTFDSNNRPNGYSLTAATLHFEVPNILVADAESVALTYDPAGGRTQTLFSVQTMDIEVPKLHLSAHVTPAPNSTDPGLVIRGDGFLFGSLTLVLDTSTFGSAETIEGLSYLKVGNFLRVNNPSLTLTNWGMTFNSNGTLSGAVLGSIGVGAAHLILGNPSGRFNAHGADLLATLTFGPNNVPNGFTFSFSNLDVSLGFVHITASNVEITPDGGTTGRLISVGVITATLDLGSFLGQTAGSPSLGGAAGNFAIRTDGSLEEFGASTPDRPAGITGDFFVRVNINPDGFGALFSRVPNPFPAGSGASASGTIAVQWPDFSAHPERFLMTINGTVGGNIGPIAASISVTDMVIDSKKILDGKFPIVGLADISGTAGTAPGRTLGGMTVAGHIIAGLVQFDTDGHPLGSTMIITPGNQDMVSDSVFYMGLGADVTLPNGWGVTLRIGFSEHGFLQGYVGFTGDIPIGGGLSISGLRGGITFNAIALPDIEDPVDLRAPIFGAPTALTENEWKSALRQLTINQHGGTGGVLFEQLESGDWTTALDGELDPATSFPASFRTAFLNAGVAITRTPNVGSVTKLESGRLWLLKNSGDEFLIEKDSATGTFTVSRLQYTFEHGYADGAAGMSLNPLPSTINGTPVLVSTIGYVDTDDAGNPQAHSLALDAFMTGRHIGLSSSATIVKTADGVWEITDYLPSGSTVSYTLSLVGVTTGGATQVLQVEGGELSMDDAAAASSHIRIDAGFSLSSTGGSTAWRLNADAVIVVGRTATDTQIVLIGALSVGPAANPTLTMDARMFLNLAHIQDATNPHADIFLLADFFAGPSSAGAQPTGIPYLSIYGHASITVTSNQFTVQLEGSQTEGLAVFDTAGLTQGAFADQKFRLGGPSSPGASDYGFARFSVQFATSGPALPSRVDFSFNTNLSLEGIISAGSVIHTSGAFVVNFATVDILGDGSGPGHTADNILLPTSMWGAAQISVSSSQISPLGSAGISGDMLATLKINISGSAQSVDIVGLDNSTQTISIKAYSFALFAGATLTFSPPVVGGAISTTIAGFFSLEIAQDGFNFLMLGTAPVPLPIIGTLQSPLQADVLGAIVIRRHDNGTPFNFLDDTFDFGGRLEMGIQTQAGINQFINFGLDLRMFLNTSSSDLAVSLPQDFMTRFAPTLGQTSLFSRLTFNPTTQTLDVVIPRGAPTTFFNPATYNAATPGNQIDAAGPYICIIGIGNFTLGNSQDLGFALSMDGSVRVKFGLNGVTHAPEFVLGIRAGFTLAPLGALTASGDITIVGVIDPISHIPHFDTWGSFQVAGSITIGQLSLAAAVSIDINTSPDHHDVPHFYNPATHTVIPSTGTPLMVDMAPGMRIFAGGGLRWNSTDIIAGEFTFAVTSQGLSMSVGAVLNLQPIGGVAVNGALDLYTSGDAVGYLSIAADIAIPGFTFSGHSFVNFNTTNAPVTLHLPYGAGGATDLSIAANSFEVFIDGHLRLFAGLLSLDGTFRLTDNPTALSVSIAASIGLADFFSTGPVLSIAVAGAATLYKNTGVLLVDVSVADIHLGIPHLLTFDLTNTYFQLNTGSAPLASPLNHAGHPELNTIAPGLKLSGTLGLTVVGLSLGSVTASVSYEPTAQYHEANGDWHIHASFNVDFFSIITLNGAVDIYSRGAFYFSLGGHVGFGNDWFGASLDASVTLDFRAQNDGNGNVLDANDLLIHGHFGGEAHAGIKVWGHFIGVSIGASADLNYDGPSHELSITITGHFGIIGNVSGTFSLGTLDFQAPPPPPRLAGPGTDSAWLAPASGGILFLNVGSNATFRNLSESTTGEQYSVEAIGPGSSAGQMIRVTAFGLVQIYDNVTGIQADFAGDTDYLLAGLDAAHGMAGVVPLTIPFTVNGGIGNDTIIVRTSGLVTVHGNDGADYIEASGSGGTLYGDAGDDTLTWIAGSETGVTLDGGASSEVNAVQVIFTAAADRVVVDRSAGGARIRRLNAAGVAFDTINANNSMILTLTGERGADEFQLVDLIGSAVKKVIVDMSQYETGATVSSTVGGVTTTNVVVASDHDADLLTIEGSSSADTMNIATGADTQDLDGDNDTTEPMLAINLPDDSAAAIIRFKVFNSIRADGDSVTINGNDGADVIDASGVTNDLAALTINGNADGDTLTGSPFADTINAGEGVNTVHGGSGNDAITAGSGNDTITGDAGDDTINAGDGTNTVDGGSGVDSITTGSGDDTIHGGSEDDTILAGNGANTVYGDAGNDRITTGSGADLIDGGDGNDAIDSGLGDDTVTGGLGVDTYADAGGRDTFIEARSGSFRDFTITDDAFIVGTVSTGSPIDFSDRYSTVSENENLAGIFEVAFITGGSGANRFAVGDVDGSVLLSGVPRAIAQRWSGTITLDGLGGGDSYFVTVFGDRGAIVNVSDTGASNSGIDRLFVFGADTALAPDTFLVRAHFIASVKDSNGDLVSDTSDRINFNNALERSAANVNDAITISGLGGDDRFISDDTSVPMTLIGGEGRDYFQFGQLFGSDRTPPYVAPGDNITTTAVDLTPAGSSTHITGYLSNGTSQPATVTGGNGDDTFLVNRTMGLLFLRGDAGNDVFTIRAFALDGTTTINQATTSVSGGADADSIEYAADAPIDIDGGEGVDSVRLLGTQFGDRFRITSDGIALLTASGGTPITVTFTAIESLELHCGDGNDLVYVVSTSASIRTAIFGGAGSDHIYFGSDPLDPNAPRTLSSIAGPVLVNGGPGDPTVFGLSTPVMLPTESNIPLPPGAGSMSDHEIPGDVDILDIDATQETRNLSGAMGPRTWPTGLSSFGVITLSGLGMGGDLAQDGQTVPGGISLLHLEVVDATLGSGQETLAVSGVLPAAITLLHGNGGADTFNISAPAASGATLVIYGDSRPGESMIGLPGDDRIDARTSSQAAIVDAGPGADTILGGAGADRFAGGSGNDIISGGSGDDLIIGDSRFIVDRLTRITTIITSGLPDSDQAGSDTINPGAGFNIVFGDHGIVAQNFGTAGFFGPAGVFTSATTVRPAIGAADVISALASANPAFAGFSPVADGQDLIFGGAGADTINSGDGADIVVGDHASAQLGQIGYSIPAGGGYGPFLVDLAFLADAGAIRVAPGGLAGEDLAPQLLITSTDPTAGAGDQIVSGAGDDIVIGGVGSDTIDSGDGNDVVFGDHGRFDAFGPLAQRFVSLFGNQAAAGAADHILAGDGNDIVMGQQGADTILGQTGDDDLIGGHNVAGGLDAADSIDGGAGDDVVLGDNGTIVRVPGARSPRLVTPNGALLPGQAVRSTYDSNFDPAVTGPAPIAPGAVWVRSVVQLDASSSTSSTLYGADQIAGGAGNDLILAGNGNDQVRGDSRIIDGPSPSLALSTDPSTDGDDYIEGNSGADTIYGDLGQDDIVGGGSSLFGLTSASRDDQSDIIFGGTGLQAAAGSAGDTSATGAARDADVIAGDNADILRLVNADGTPIFYNYDAGAPLRIIPRVVRLLDYTADGLPAGDTGAADTIHGEAGADTIYGMTGDDALFGDGQNDDLIGGSGDDWIYGGTGNDGVLGDDGRLLTARSGVAEPIFGLDAQSQQTAASGDQVFSVPVFTPGEVLKFARLQAPSAGGADVIFGGLGNDAIHGGGGQDAISGAEALPAFAAPPVVRPTLSFNVGLRRFTLFNPGFALQKLPNFFLNFDAGPLGAHIDDGADAIFGDDGNDWLVGGTNSDRIFGGLGDDVLNGDDNLDTSNGSNSIPDVGLDAAPDILFGGAGLDRLIGNVTTDRLIDWNGEFNQYITPFTAGFPTIVKSPNDTLVSGLRLLGSGSGMDSRLTEPHGELGILLNTDPTWLDEYGRALI